MWNGESAAVRNGAMVLAMVCALGLGACAAIAPGAIQAPVFKLNDKIGAGEGAILLMNHSSFRDEVSYSFERLTGDGGTYSSGNFGTGARLRMITLPAGTYQLRQIRVANAVHRSQGVKFMVAPGVMNYPGDLYVGSGGGCRACQIFCVAEVMK